MQGFKSAILAIFHFWQNGTFEPLHEIQKLFLPIAELRVVSFQPLEDALQF